MTQDSLYGVGVAHEKRDYARDLAIIDNKVTQLFSLVAGGLVGATDAFLASDASAAGTIISRDRQLDELYWDIEEIVQKRFAFQAPLGQDLRYCLSVLRIVPELERSGDLVEHIAQRAARGLANELTPRLRGLVERMGTVTAGMWQSLAEAYVARDGDIAARLRARDDEVDSLHVALTAEVVASQPPMPVAIEMALIARFYERLGDHAVNVASRIGYLVHGSPSREHAASDGDSQSS